MKRRRQAPWTWGIAAICAVVVAACGDDRPAPAAAPVPADEPSVERSDTSVADWVGVMVPTDALDLLAPYASTIAAMPVSVGQRVAVGDVVATLDPRPIREEIAAARAGLASAQASLRAARVSLEAAQATLARNRAGVAAGFMAADQVTIAEFEEKRVAASVAQSEAAVSQQRAALAVLQDRVARTQIRATMAGEIATKYVEVGGKVEKEASLLRIIGKKSMVLRFAVPITDSASVAPGTRLGLACNVGDQPISASAEVTHMSPETDPVSQMVLGEATLINVREGTFAPGTVCRITR